MPITVWWDDEAQTIAIYALEGECTQEEMTNAQRELAALTANASHRIGVIVDMRNTSMLMPTNTVSYPSIEGKERRPGVIRGDFGVRLTGGYQTGEMFGYTPSSQVKITVFIMPDILQNTLKDIFQTMVRVTGINATFATTFEEARKIIADHLSNKREE